MSPGNSIPSNCPLSQISCHSTERVLVTRSPQSSPEELELVMCKLKFRTLEKCCSSTKEIFSNIN